MIKIIFQIKLCIIWLLSNLAALTMQGERGLPGQQGVQGQPGRAIPGPKVDQIKSHNRERDVSMEDSNQKVRAKKFVPCNVKKNQKPFLIIFSSQG